MPFDIMLQTGWIETNIRALLPVLVRVSTKAPFCLVTCLDSETRLVETEGVRRLEPGIIVGCPRSSPGILLKASSVFALADRDGWFTGFDEIWFLPREPAVAKPPTLSIVPPVEYTPALASGLDAWMRGSGSVLGIAGGLGLNYATPQPWIDALIRGWGERNSLPMLQGGFGGID